MFIVSYLVVDALAVLISTPYMLYTPSVSEKVFNGKISCGLCSNPSHLFSVCVICTFFECKHIQWTNILWSML